MEKETVIKCPYCGGEMLVANATAKTICEYCDQEIILSNTADEQVSCEKAAGRLKGIDLFKLSPKKNCQECGSPTCMAFCLKVVQGVEEIDKCPYFSEEAKTMVSNVSAKEAVLNKKTPADDLLNVYIQTLNDDALQTWQTICGCLNSEYSYDEYIDLLEGMAKDKPDRITTPAINNSLYKKITERVSSRLLPGEKILFYIDNGILSCGKGGVLITSARVFGLKKKDLNTIRYEDVKSIYATESAVTWKINNEISVDCYHCSYKQLGVILAFILYMSRACHTDGYKINAYQK